MPQLRYKVNRLLSSFEKTPETAVLKMVAAVVYWEEGVRRKAQLWERVRELYPRLTEIVLGRRVEFQDVLEQIEREQGPERRCTPEKLANRAYCTKHYNEYNAYWDAVLKTHRALDATSRTADESVRPLHHHLV